MIREIKFEDREWCKNLYRAYSDFYKAAILRSYAGALLRNPGHVQDV